MHNSIQKYNSVILFILFAISSIIIPGCASRENSPRTLDDSTIIYPSKSENGIYATITFSNKLSKKTGKPIKADTLFALDDKAKLYATIDLVNYKSVYQKPLMLHVDWLDSTGNSFYKKRTDFTPSDSTTSFTSSISISPQKKKAGKYLLRVYLFRELISEKYFHLAKSVSDSKNVRKKELSKKKSKTEKKDENQQSVKPKVIKESLKASIILCKKISKKTGKPIGVDTIFTIRDKAKVKAIVNFEKEKIKTNEQLKFYFNWTDPGGNIFYKKRIIYTTSNPIFSLSNSISISPEKRIQGNYKIQIIYKKKIIAEQKFVLVTPDK
jgi:hypothetical protein